MASDPVWFIVSKINGVEYPGVLIDPVARRLLATEHVIGKLRIDDRPDFAELATLNLDDLHKRLKDQVKPVEAAKK